MKLKNADFALKEVLINQQKIPILVPEKYNNCWTTSLMTSIGPMMRDEIKRANLGIFGLILEIASFILEKIGRILKIDDAIFPYNFAFTTQLYEKGQIDFILDNKQKLQNKFNDKAIILRGINQFNFDIKKLKEQNIKFLPSRIIFYSENQSEIIASRDFKRDIKAFKKANLKYRRFKNNIDDESLNKILTHYEALYIEKYSIYNPQFTNEYIKELMKYGLEFETLEDDSGIIGFATIFERNSVICSPLLGYDLGHKLPIYRFLMSLCVNEAINNKKALNHSSGAANFKQNRGLKPYFEYMIIVDDHLPFLRRAYYSFISALFKNSSSYLMKVATE